jgi:hypothetical protein
MVSVCRSNQQGESCGFGPGFVLNSCLHSVPSSRHGMFSAVRSPVALLAGEESGGRKRYAARVVEEDKPPMNGTDSRDGGTFVY